jgi:hypothetical protein
MVGACKIRDIGLRASEVKEIVEIQMTDAEKLEWRKRRLARLILANWSISRARLDAAYVVKNVKSGNDPVFRAFECAVAVCYARPFVGTKKAGRISSNYDKFDGQPALKSLHDSLIEHRHACAAHTCETLNTVSFVKPGGRLKGQHGEFVIAGGRVVNFRHIKLSTFSKIVELCQFQLKRLRNDIEKEEAELLPP